ncbi:MAG TPA: SDR family oxidoreductase [Pseudoxanthomonas sp.]|nr:SDR family oxidoreductase [Pseudoxanthomonas sp.]
MNIDSLILVTGASTGIGRAIALEFDCRGYRVLAGVRREADGNALLAASSGRLRAIQLDVTDGGHIAEAASLVTSVAEGGGLAALVNNAGHNLNGAFEYADEARARAMMEVNFFGLHRLSQALIPALRRHAEASGRTAKLINIGSIASTIGLPWQAFYHASKFAVLGLSESLRHELYAQRIRVCAVLPGGVRTPFLQKTDKWVREAEAALPASVPQNYRKGLGRIAELMATAERFGSEPETVARRVARIVHARNPRLRHYVGSDARLIRALKALPGWIQEPLVRRAMGA